MSIKAVINVKCTDRARGIIQKCNVLYCTNSSLKCEYLITQIRICKLHLRVKLNDKKGCNGNMK